jgi:hypothetical protein
MTKDVKRLSNHERRLGRAKLFRWTEKDRSLAVLVRGTATSFSPPHRDSHTLPNRFARSLRSLTHPSHESCAEGALPRANRHDSD